MERNFLTKPWQRDELQSHVAEALERWRLRAEQRRLTDELHRHNAELAAVNQDLRHLASRDRMTGLLNRAEFEDALRVEAAAWKPRRPLCLALADVDEFKAINDAHGHPAGDAVLRALAAHLATGVRSEHDAVYRYGGEEFAVLLRDTALDTAAIAMERLRGAVAAEPMASPAGPLAVTMSFGVGALGAVGDPAGLVAAVDAALYRAKAGGRNRVVVA